MLIIHHQDGYDVRRSNPLNSTRSERGDVTDNGINLVLPSKISKVHVAGLVGILEGYKCTYSLVVCIM